MFFFLRLQSNLSQPLEISEIQLRKYLIQSVKEVGCFRFTNLDVFSKLGCGISRMIWMNHQIIMLLNLFKNDVYVLCNENTMKQPTKIRPKHLYLQLGTFMCHGPSKTLQNRKLGLTAYICHPSEGTCRSSDVQTISGRQ